MARPLCPHCQLPLARCLCDCAIECQSTLEIIVWQHPSETDHPKNTVPLLKACLPQIRIIRGELISKDEFLASTNSKNGELRLLFPSNESPLTRAKVQTENDSKLSLVAIDGTWRKARKIMHLNPWLHQLPRIALIDAPTSRYHIRKAEQDGQLSTLEAVCTAIEQLEDNRQTGASIRAAFEQYLLKLSVYRP